MQTLFDNVSLDGCPWDCDGSNDGNANVIDLLTLLAVWNGSGPCDFDGTGVVDVVDLLKLLAHLTTNPLGIGCP